MAEKKTTAKAAEEIKAVVEEVKEAAAVKEEAPKKAATKKTTRKTTTKKTAAKKPAEKKTTEKKPVAKKPAAKKPAAKKAVEVIIQSELGGEITADAILAKVGEVEKIYVRVDQNKAYWVRGEETGSVDLW